MSKNKAHTLIGRLVESSICSFDWTPIFCPTQMLFSGEKYVILRFYKLYVTILLLWKENKSVGVGNFYCSFSKYAWTKNPRYRCTVQKAYRVQNSRRLTRTWQTTSLLWVKNNNNKKTILPLEWNNDNFITCCSVPMTTSFILETCKKTINK